MKQKKTRHIFLASIVFLFTLLTIISGTAYASSDNIVKDGLVYTLFPEAGTATVTGYTEDLPTEVEIPSRIDEYTITKVGDEAFAGCSSINSIVIPATVNTIGQKAFYQTGLIYVTIEPSNHLEFIGTGAFELCVNLSCIHYIGTENNWNCISKSDNWTDQPETIVHFVTETNISKAKVDTDGEVSYVCTDDNCDEWSYVDGIARPDSFTLSSASYIYNGKEKKPTVTIKDSNGIIVDPANYDVSYSKNTNAGTAIAKATFVGDLYEGEKDMAFKINTKKVTPTVALSTSSYTYNGKTKTPSVTVKDGSAVLKKGTDYTVTYAPGRKNAGKYKVTVTLKGNYSGTASKSFKINKASNPLKIKAKSATVNHRALKKKNQTLSISKVIAFTKKGQGSLTYAKASGNKKISIDKKTGKVTIKKGLKKGSYKVKIKVKAAGNNNYKPSPMKTVTVKIIVKKIKTNPLAVTRLTGSSKGTITVKLSWKKASAAKRYQIFRKTPGSKTWKKIATVKSSKTTYSNTGLTPNTKYQYKVRAYKTYISKGKTKYKYGKYSNVITLTTKKPLKTITLKDGYFTAGVDIPAGVFDVTATAGVGYILSDIDSANLRGPEYKKSDFDDFYDYYRSFANYHFPKGDLLEIKGVQIKIYYTKITASASGRKYNESSGIELNPGYYKVGTDIAPGRYCVKYISGEGGYVDSDREDGDCIISSNMDGDPKTGDYTDYVSNVLLKNGEKIHVTDGLTVLFIPETH